MRPTREGVRFLLATALIALAALNTGNNFIYLILGMLLSVLLLSYLLLRINLSGLHIKVEADHPVFAGSETFFRISVKNKKRWLRSYSLKVVLPQGLLAEEQSGYVPFVGASSTEFSEVSLIFRRRGHFSYGDFMLQSSFPFIFFKRSVKVPVSGDVIVYPRLREVELDAFKRGSAGESTTSMPGRSDDLLMIREFRDGDDFKHINWKASARSKGLMVREFTAHEPRTITIVLDNSAPAEEFAFERGVSFAASVAWQMGLAGYMVRLLMCGVDIPFATGIDHVYRILDKLAEVKDASRDACPELGELEGMSVLVLKSESSPLMSMAQGEDTVIVHAASAL
jgi:uncharacterized protein (DUF58 family)